MKGLELAREYYEACRPILERQIPDIFSRAACGLAGEGSECFGLDDEQSRDHDFGAAFCLWLPDDLLAQNRGAVEKAMADLPKNFLGFNSRMGADTRMGRIGPIGISSFYQSLTGLDRPPKTWREWLFLPEERVACAVNGEIFVDNEGQFSAWRKLLLEYYPEDVRLKKMAARVMNMAQAGQYNLPRSLKRNDLGAAFLAIGEFARATLGFVFLLNKTYMPYYKLAPRRAAQLPIMGAEVAELLASFGQGAITRQTVERVENFCALCALVLREQGLSDEQDAWLWLHGPSIASRIGERELLARDLLHD